MSKDTLLQVWLDAQTVERLDTVCEKHAITRPEVMRRALRDAVEKLESHPPAFPTKRPES